MDKNRRRKKLIVKKATIRLSLLILCFRVALDLSYKHVVSPIYAYSGLTISVNPWRVIESYILTLAIGLISPSVIAKPSDFLVWMLSVGTIIPTLSYYGMHSGSRAFMYAVVFSFLTIVALARLPSFRIPTLKKGRAIGIAIMLLVTLIVLLSLIAKGGLSHFNLALSKVYEHRRDVGDLINVGPWAYVNTWVFKVINPALICWAFWRKRYRLVLVFTGLQTLFFGISSHKAVLFYPFLIAGVYIFSRKRRALEYLTAGLIVVVLVSSFTSLVFDFNWLASLFVRRTFFVPARLNFVYHDLFSAIGHVYLSNSVLSRIIDYPFPEAPPLMVSDYLYGHTNAWANNGFIATGYMHFGYVGMLAFATAVGLLLVLVDVLTDRRLPLWVGISIVTVPFRSLFTSADLFTSLLTHGILVALAILLLIGNKQDPVSPM